MGVRATVIMSGLVLTLAACGSTAQNVKSIDAVPVIDTTDGSIPDVTLPGGVTIPSIPDISIPTITIPADVTLPGGVTIPGGTIPGFTIPIAPATRPPAATDAPSSDAPTVTDAPTGTTAPPAGGTQSVGADGLTLSIPSDWTSVGGGDSTVTLPAGVSGSTALFTSPAGESLVLTSVPIDYALYKSALPTLAGSGGTVTETKIDGRDAAIVDASAGGGGVSEYLLIDGGSGKSFFVVFNGSSDSSKAIADSIFQSIKIAG